MKLLKRLLQTAGPLNWILLASIGAGLLATTLQVSLLWAGFTALFRRVPQLWWLLLIFALVGGFARFFEQYLGHLAAFKILAHLRNRVYQQIMRLAPAKLDHARSSDVLKLLTEDIDQIEIFYAHTLAPVVIAVVVSLGFVVFFGLIQPLFGVIALIAYVLIGMVVPLVSQRQFGELSNQLNHADLDEQRLMVDAVTGKLELQQYQAVDQHLHRLRVTGQHFWRLDRQKNGRQTRAGVTMQLILVLSLAAVIAVVKLTDAPLVAALVFPFTFGRVLALGNLPGSLGGGLLAARHVFDLLDEQPLVTNTGTAPLRTINHFQLANVNFAYPQRPDTPILNQTNLAVQRGERVGLIGPSGAGKSTIMKLVMRWYVAQSGQVQVNGDLVDTYKLDRLRGPIAYVPQNAQLFSGTLRENLTLRDPLITDARIREVLNWVELAPTIAGLPEQLDTVVTRSAPVLSAGEVQRLELARALVRNSSLLILDEPTSNLDVLNEALILKTVKQHYTGTVVLITHRRSSLALCDRVLKLDHGRLVPFEP
ncbi:ABC transporter ATP-binding protein [Lactiplantibacillus garii]|uniref:ABC transporter ATP-binding protein n=1 Tax=Lactiplantibacillus garii TaxID=2306423 RepID=A0A3R8KE15_9LACO|nr:ABC transporter ATP-binding protein [Lactiplantibacillus garii]RRK10131.1 ABC transporter ATP-binding protein [Lactiplantibacillus garii]